MNVAFCTTCCGETQYLKEWVDYHYSLGVDHFIIYDKNTTNEYPSVELQQYIKDGIVTIEDWRDKSDKLQWESFNNCIINYGQQYDWIGFFDLAEFFTLGEYMIESDLTSIKDYLELPMFDKYDVIQLHWILYGDCENIQCDKNKGVLERFKYPLPNERILEWHKWSNSYQSQNINCKSICRTNKKSINFFIEGCTDCCSELPRISYNENLKYCSSYGTEQNGFNSAIFLNKLSFAYAYLRHYRTKSLEECLLKSNNIRPDLTVNNIANTKITDIFFRLFLQYAPYNIMTDEKIEYITEYVKNILNEKKNNII